MAFARFFSGGIDLANPAPAVLAGSRGFGGVLTDERALDFEPDNDIRPRRLAGE
jgi:hypothetical protein